MSYPTVVGRAVVGIPMHRPRVSLGALFANAYYTFFVSAPIGPWFPATVYQNAALTVPFPSYAVVADAYGRFPAIWLDTSVSYRVALFSSSSMQLWLVDPYPSQISTFGTSSLSAQGFQVAATGEVTVDAPNAFGSGASLTLNAGTVGTTALALNGTVPGNSPLIINSSVTTGAQSAAFTASNKPGTSSSAPAGWLPITCDGVQYYAPVWHGNPFTPYTSNPSALGQTIVGSSVTFTGNGLTTVVNGTANPSNWFAPPSANIGTGYFINITKTGGLSGQAFTQSAGTPGTWTGINTGLTIGNNAFAQITGTYQLSTSSGGSPVVASGTITLNGTSGVISGPVSGPGPLVLNGDGTTSLAGAPIANWYSPTTSNIGNSYYLSVNRTNGYPGIGFSLPNNTPTLITGAGLTLVLTGLAVPPYSASGTYSISSDSAGLLVLGMGTINLTSTGFTPVTRIYSNGASGTETVPSGATSVFIEASGGGGSGSSVAGSGNESAGSGAAFCSSRYTVTGGQTLSYAVGAGAAAAPAGGGQLGNNGGATTVSGSVTGGLVSMSAGGGYRGNVSGVAVPGGFANGGNVSNVAGNAGTAGPGAVGGAGIAGTYLTAGAGGTSDPAVAGGSYGAGSGSSGSFSGSAAGGGGAVAFHYT